MWTTVLRIWGPFRLSAGSYVCGASLYPSVPVCEILNEKQVKTLVLSAGETSLEGLPKPAFAIQQWVMFHALSDTYNLPGGS